jgi:hypothetical protein
MRSFQASWAAALRAREQRLTGAELKVRARAKQKGEAKVQAKGPSTCRYARCLAPFSLEQDDWLCSGPWLARLARNISGDGDGAAERAAAPVRASIWFRCQIE